MQIRHPAHGQSAGHALLTEGEVAQLIRTHYHLQKGAFISEWQETDKWIRIFSDLSPLPLWNHVAALTRSSDEESLLSRETAESWPKADRPPVVYLLDRSLTESSEDQMEAPPAFERCDQEAWMIYEHQDAPKVSSLSPLEIRVAENAQQHSTCVEVFSAAYRAKARRYARIFQPDSGDAARHRQMVHYLAYAQGQPVCTATLALRTGLACIYNVGTLPQARKRGFAAQVTARLIRDALEKGCFRIFLQAERGGAAERLYSRIGFWTTFGRSAFRLKDWSPEARSHRGKAPSASTRRAGGILSAVYRDQQSVNLAPEYALELASGVAPLSRSVRDFCNCLSLNPEVPWLAAWAIVLSRYSHESRIGFHVADQALSAQRLGRRVLHVEVQGDLQIAEWLRLVNRLADSPGAGPEELAGTGSDLLRPDTTVVLQNTGEDSDFAEVESPLCWRIPEAGSTLLALRYDRHCFEQATVVRLVSHLLTALAALVRDSHKTIGAVEILTPAERELMLVEWNNERPPLGDTELLHRQFEAQANRTPGAPAVVLITEPSAPILRYAELNTRANQLARHLLQAGAGPDRIVGICIERSLEMLVALLAVFKAGAICLPLDPACPKERLEFILGDAQAAVLLGDSATLARLPRCSARRMAVDMEGADAQGAETTNLESSPPLESAAYIVYTSGSTGQPKGVVISQKAIAAHCTDVAQSYGVGPNDRVLQFNSLSFDAAFEQIWSTLISGAALVLRGPDAWTPQDLGKHITTHGLTIVDLPTAYWQQVLEQWVHNERMRPDRWPRLFVVGGEAMSPRSLRHWRELPTQSVRLINAYGPTEATVTATTFEITPCWLDQLPGRVPIGRPRGPRRAYVLDRAARPVPIGVSGELCLGGPLLAIGYLNRADLTQEKFVPNPFVAATAERLYRTGDLVRYRADGNLEFLGRIDQQVKIRGYRIELGEIESALQTHPDVREAAVMLREDADRHYLAAYFVPRNGHCPSARELRAFLQRTLPDYMLPSNFVPLGAFPRLPGGKLDRRSLPVIEPEPKDQPVTGPRDAIELRLQLLFERILRQQGIGVDVSFFELGGDSLQALELIVEIEHMSGRSLPLGTLYQSSSVEALAKVLKTDPAIAEWSSLVPLQTGGARPPLFFVHTTPGDILGYGNLIYHLDPEQRCYGLQSRGLFRPELSHQRIEDMATYYVGLVRSLQPEGPYYLAGWCYGGIVAVEMAQQLQSFGEPVAFLGLLETIAPAPSFRVHRYYVHRLRCLLRMHPRQWLRYLVGKVRYHRELRVANKMRFRRLEKATAGTPTLIEEHNRKLAKLEHVYNTNLAALHQYRLQPYAGRITLFNAAEADPGMITDALYAWPGLAHAIEVHIVPGNHDTMLMEPNVAVLAQKLDACLRQAQLEQRQERVAGSEDLAAMCADSHA
jgi:amino acid adenylation domain-containing protein